MLSLLLVAGFAFGQQEVRKISGVVTSVDEKAPIEGVTVKAKVSGKISGTQADGVYYITVSAKDSVLLFSRDGFETREVRISSEGEKNVELNRVNSFSLSKPQPVIRIRR
jgi:iron complex outermembrane receptor protein